MKTELSYVLVYVVFLNGLHRLMTPQRARGRGVAFTLSLLPTLFLPSAPQCEISLAADSTPDSGASGLEPALITHD